MIAQKIKEFHDAKIAAHKAFEALRAAHAVEHAWSAYVRDEATQISKAEANEIAEARAAVEAADEAFTEAKAELAAAKAELAAAKSNALSHRIDKATFALDSVLMLQGHNFNDATRGALEYVLTTLHEVSKTR